ncbi:MAG TPA: hypothetical protein VFG22_13825 [Polyangiales bacterium]|nr:hypothetical protein [Polyangiales bacterium]
MDEGTYDLEDGNESAARPKRPGLPVEPRRLLRILAEHRKPLLKAFLIAAGVSILGSFFVPRTFESSAQLLYEGTPVLERKEQETTADASAASAMAQERLREVRDRINWSGSLTNLERHLDATVEDELRTSLRISARAGDAEEAHAMATAMLEVFLEHQASFNARRLEILSAETRVALESAKARRDQATQEYDAFRRKSGKPNLLQEQDQLLKRAALLRSQADEAAVEVLAQQARIEELERAQEDLPRQIVSSAKKGSPIDSPLSEARSELAAARASLSDQHPTVQALTQRVESLQAQRKGEKSELGEQTVISNPARATVDQEIATARAAFAAAKERESALRVLLKANKAETESLAPEEGEARRIVGELEAASDRVKSLSERSAVLRDAAMGPLTGFRVLSSPAVPEASTPSPLYVALLILLPLLTVTIFALVVITRQLRSLTLEAPREVAWWGNGPVLGTSVWPRDSTALDTFVDELEDHGIYGAGRTLVVPATDAEREIALSFAMRLAQAPWLAAAILDIDERASSRPYGASLVTPPPGGYGRHLTPPPVAPPRRLSAQGMPSMPPGRVIQTPPPQSSTPGPSPSRPPRKKTMVGLPAVQSSHPPSAAASSTGSPTTSDAPSSSSGPEPFRRKRRARASVRMVVPVNESLGTSGAASSARDSAPDEEAFLLTRPVPIATEQTEQTEPRVGRAVHVATEMPPASASDAVMRAAVRLLGNGEDDITGPRPSNPPNSRVVGEVTGVALAWNGPLSGPVLRRAARLAHRVMVVVSSGMSAVDLARIHTRLGRENGVGYVLVNVSDAYVDLKDRVGPVEEFWAGLRDADPLDSRRP